MSNQTQRNLLPTTIEKANSTNAITPSSRSREPNADLDASDSSLVWQLKRNRNLTPKQLFSSIGILIPVSLTIGITFYSLGYWPIMPFVGIELLALVALSFYHARHVTDGETIALAPDGMLHIEQERGSAIKAYHFEAHRTQIAYDEQRKRVLISSGKQQVWVGKFLREADRPAWAREALRRIRQHSNSVDQMAVHH